MKKILVKMFAFFNMAEGFIHLIVASIGMWGVYDTGVWDWRLLVAPIENFIFGVFSLATGWFIHDMSQGKEETLKK